jgi:hypothetical protein
MTDEELTVDVDGSAEITEPEPILETSVAVGDRHRHGYVDPMSVRAFPSAKRFVISLNASIKSCSSVCSTIIDPDPTLTSTLARACIVFSR